MIDPFEQLVREEGTAHFRAKQRARAKRESKHVVNSEKDAPMKLSELEQKVADSSKQFRSYLRANREELTALLKGSQGEHWRELMGVLRTITLQTEFDLVDYVRSQPWIYDADLHTRQVALGIMAGKIIRLNLENGYPPFNDSLFGEPPTVFEIIRNELQVLT